MLSCAGAYVSGAAGSNECPPGSVRIEAEAACRTAAIAAGKTPDSPFVGTNSGWPKGCYYDSINYVYFNTHEVGAGRPNAQLLCAAATTGALLKRRRRTDAGSACIGARACRRHACTARPSRAVCVMHGRHIDRCAHIYIIGIYTHMYTRMMPTALVGGAARQRRRAGTGKAQKGKKGHSNTGTQKAVLKKGYSKRGTRTRLLKKGYSKRGTQKRCSEQGYSKPGTQNRLLKRGTQTRYSTRILKKGCSKRGTQKLVLKKGYSRRGTQKRVFRTRVLKTGNSKSVTQKGYSKPGTQQGYSKGDAQNGVLKKFARKGVLTITHGSGETASCGRICGVLAGSARQFGAVHNGAIFRVVRPHISGTHGVHTQRLP